MDFINLNTGKVYNGDQPYIHWFNGEHGTGLIYSQCFCFIYSKQNATIKLQSNVFSLLNMDATTSENDLIEDEYINGFTYKNIDDLKTGTLNSTGVPYEDKYIHVFYIIVKSDTPNEYIDTFYIDDNSFSVGVDLYDSNEALTINASNFGINIPNEVQKAIYPYNVHNDVDDKILLNRKLKELLSNYWDIVANRGSYKSLFNSLKWFEWGELLSLKELWKYDNLGTARYCEKDIQNYLIDLYSKEMSRFAKTTYYSIGMALQELKGVDEYFNPLPIQKNIPLWSKQDLALKLSLLGSFFETYFMPIHLDLIHATIEDIVFTKPINLTAGSKQHTSHECLNLGHIRCNNKDHYLLNNISTQVNKNTVFKNPELSYSSYIFGVDNQITNISNDEDLKLFMSQLYCGVGVMIPLEYDIYTKHDIQKEQLFVRINNGDWKICEEYKYLKSESGKVKFAFNILCREEAKYELKLNFIDVCGNILCKSIQFDVIDDLDVSLGIFRIKNLTPSLEQWYNGIANDYNLERFINPSNQTILQYIPADNINKTGIRLNNVLIFLSTELNDRDYFDEQHVYLREHYFITHNDKITRDADGNIISRYQYTVCVSKEFDFDPSEWLDNASDSPKAKLYKNSYEYFPEFHYLEPLGGDSLDDYTVHDNDAICAIPYIAGDQTKTLKFGEYIEPYEWTIENTTTGQIINLPGSIREPYITDGSLSKTLDPGYYNIRFRYKLGSNIKELKLLSAFRKIKLS